MQNWMIENRKKLADCIEADRMANLGKKVISFEMKYRSNNRYLVCRYLELLRKLEYVGYRRDNSKNKAEMILFAQLVKLLDRRRNCLGRILGLEIPENHVMPGVRIAHANVILNGYVGENCIFHGNNVLGNKRTGEKKAIPRLGKNVDVGVGAMVIGDVEIADNCVIGAGAVVTKSFTIPGTIIVGVPAREMKG